MGPVEVGLGLQEPGRGSEALHQTGDGQQDSPVEGQVLSLLGFGQQNVGPPGPVALAQRGETVEEPATVAGG